MRVDSQVADRRASGAEQHRRDVGDDLVDQAGPQERRGEGRAALEEHVLAVAGEQVFQRRLGVAGAQVDGLGGVVEDPRGRGRGRAPPSPPAAAGAASGYAVGVADGQVRGRRRRPCWCRPASCRTARAAGGCRAGRPGWRPSGWCRRRPRCDRRGWWRTSRSRTAGRAPPRRSRPGSAPAPRRRGGRSRPRRRRRAASRRRRPRPGWCRAGRRPLGVRRPRSAPARTGRYGRCGCTARASPRRWRPGRRPRPG